MNGSNSFMGVLGKNEEQIAQDIDEFVEQFEASKRSQKTTSAQGEGDEEQLYAGEKETRQAAAECLSVLVNIKEVVRDAFDDANPSNNQGGIIAQAEAALQRIVQTESIGASGRGSVKTLDPAEASGLIIRCRKYWKLNTESPMDLGTHPSLKPYGEFLEYVSGRFELDPDVLFSRELEIRERERALKERARTQRSESGEAGANPA